MIIDIHVHAAVKDDEGEFAGMGNMSRQYQESFVFKVFLLYAGLEDKKITNELLHKTAVDTILKSGADKAVCLALDPVYKKETGERREDLSDLWVDNEYIIKLREDTGGRVMLGASVHPYDPAFRRRVDEYVSKGAVLLKWLPSAMQIDLAEKQTGDAMKYLAKTGLPLLLHVGPEHAVPTSDKRTTSWDYLSWSITDKLANLFNRYHKPKLNDIRRNIETALDAGTNIIFAHCGLNYYPRFFFEHSDFKVVRNYLNENITKGRRGKAYADVSSFCTPVRRAYFDDVNKLPADFLLFGSDFPTPVFELTGDLKEAERDLKAIMKGSIKRIVIPQKNMISLNYDILSSFFPGHPMFNNFEKSFLKKEHLKE